MSRKTKTPKNASVAAVLMPATQMMESSRVKELPEPRNMKQFLGLSAQIAQDTVYCRNMKFPRGIEFFPTDPLMRTCDKYFQFAVGGPLWVDEPSDPVDIRRCIEKAKVMEVLGLRYVYISDDAELEDVLKQLKERPRGVA